jgi:predicted flap endonuclease-1-like 5' DNA nuclease
MPEDSAPAPRLTLAMRMAERSRLRAERAERLARLAPAPALSDHAPAAAAVPLIASERDAAAALEEFLCSLTQGLNGGTAPAASRAAGQPAGPGAVLPFQRPAETGRAAPSDLERLEGVGPGLLWALRRAGIAALADLAALEPDALAARLGPLGRLVPAREWIAAARSGA